MNKSDLPAVDFSIYTSLTDSVCAAWPPDVRRWLCLADVGFPKF
jgi:hypothetical protein